MRPSSKPKGRRSGLFVFQFEALSRNRLGYNKGLAAMADDPVLHRRLARLHPDAAHPAGRRRFRRFDLRPVRAVRPERRRLNPDFIPKFPILFGEKEGKIARANRGRDPMYLFAALQRQLGYPEVPRPRRPDELEARVRSSNKRSPSSKTASSSPRATSIKTSISRRCSSNPKTPRACPRDGGRVRS